MSKLEQPTWFLELPSGWRASQQEDVITIEASELPGSIQISSFEKDGLVTPDDILEFADDDSPSAECRRPVKFPGYRGLQSTGTESGIAMTRWYLRHASQMLFVTYSRPAAEQYASDALVSEVLSSLWPVPH
jgi:hypothetical protein